MEVKIGDYTKGVSGTADTPEDIRVLSRRSLDERAIGENNISGNNLIHSETPVTRGVAVTTMSEVPANSDTRASSVRERPLTLRVNSISKVAKTYTTANLDDTSAGVEFNLLERLETDHHGAIFAARAEAGIRVTARLGLDLDVVLSSADDGILNILLGLGKNNDRWLERTSQIEWLNQLSVVTIRGHLVRNILAVQALQNTASCRKCSGCRYCAARLRRA